MILTVADLGAQNTSRMEKNQRKLSSGQFLVMNAAY